MKNLQTRIKTDLVTEPVTSVEAKLFCKITGSAEDALITILISAARKALEKYTASSFAEKTIYATWVDLPEDNLLEIPYGPVISIDAVYWIDEEGTEELAVLNTDYWVYGDQDATVKMTTLWTTGLKNTSSVRVEYKAGYGHANTETLPTDLKLAIMKEIVTQYEMRENISFEGGVTLSNASKRLADTYRKKLWF